jgi:hypothetical protein
MECLECPREQELVDAVTCGRWPNACGGTLREHVAVCANCREVADVTTVLYEDASWAERDARVPSSGLVWWRATIRARAEATRAAERPISAFQSIAAACAAGLACGLVGAAWRSVQWLPHLGDMIMEIEPRRLDLAPASALVIQYALPVALGLGACLLLAPVALYLALSDD